MDLLQQTLRPITHALPPPISQLGTSLLGEHCYKLLVLDIDPAADPECLKLAVSKGLGMGIVAASSIVKVPQILKLVSSRSAEGVSFLAYLLETAAYLISLAYNVRKGFPFSTYGETALILVQNVVIAVLVLVFGGRSATAGVFVAGLAAAVGALFGGVEDLPGLGALGELVDMKTMGVLQAGAGALGVLSKVPQIVAIWQEGGTGQLSAFTVFNYLLGSLTRIFTTLQEVDDKLILYGFVAGFVLNAVLAAQMVYYWNAPSSKAKGKKKRAVGSTGPTTRSVSASATGSSTKGRSVTRRKA